MRRTRKEGSSAAPQDPWVTLPTAARMIGRHRQTVLGIAHERGLTIDRRAGMTFLLRAEVVRVAEEMSATAAA